MVSVNRSWGIMVIAFFFIWEPFALAQSAGPRNVSPSTNAASSPEKPVITNPVICDSSGKICIETAGRAPAAAPPAARLSTPTSSASVKAVSPSSGATPHLRPSKSRTATVTLLLICDASGKICRSVSSAPVPRSQPGVSQEPAFFSHGSGQVDGVGAYEGVPTEDPFDWVVDAYKSKHRLELYFKGHLYRSYHAVFGRSQTAGAKLWEGDRRTPEGDYLIVGKHRSARFGWFLHINYPNKEDHQRFEEGRAAHLIPASASEGGQIGIHGTDSPYLNVAEIDWTTGCISVNNSDIDELAHLLPVGSLVIIKP